MLAADSIGRAMALPRSTLHGRPWHKHYLAVLNMQRTHTGSLRTYHTYLESAIREPGISTAVSPLADLVEPVDAVHF
jgi:hypothetical protein